MAEIRLVCVGKLREEWQRAACAEYVKRIGRFMKISVMELKDQPDDDPHALEAEGERILKILPEKCFAVAMAIRGKEMDTRGFSDFLYEPIANGRDVALIIGGSSGLSEAVYARADARVSFSKLTFPHGLMRVILLEQVYRALTIRAGHPYHK